MAITGPLATNIGKIIGVGQGRGIGLMFIFVGLLTMLAAAGAYIHPRIQRVEDELPDTISGGIDNDNTGAKL
jgi:hypothetical protein